MYEELQRNTQKSPLFDKPFISQVPLAVAFVVSLNLPVCSNSHEEKNRDSANTIIRDSKIYLTMETK